VIVANGGGRLPRRLSSAPLIVCADGGVQRALRAGWRPHEVVGDLDSLDPATEAWLVEVGASVYRHPPDKDKTDTELAVDLVVQRGFRSCYLVAALGGRVDHTLANLLLLRYAADRGLDLRILDGRTYVQLVRGRTVLDARPGDIVSLFSLQPTSRGITTRGLRFSLVGGSLVLGSSLGVSNEVTEPEPAVEVLDGELVAVRIRRRRKGGSSWTRWSGP